MRTVRRLVAAALFAAALVIGWRFAQRNAQGVGVDVLFAQLPAQPLWLVLILAFGLGALGAGLIGLYQGARLGLTARRWRRTAERLELEIHQLRNLPLAGQPEAAPRDALDDRSA
jgi:hypothetical protein